VGAGAGSQALAAHTSLALTSVWVAPRGSIG
jgi:hypothetical protein